MIETLAFTSTDAWLQARTRDITSTEIAALFGCSPYLTAFELWHRKKAGTLVEHDTNERMTWGTRLQAAIAQGVAEDEGWTIRRMDEYLRLPAYRLGASFDFAIDPDGLLEIKNVDALQFKDGWLVDGDEIEAPPHIELQVQQQLLVSGRAHTKLGALVGGNRVTLLHRAPMPDIHAAIKAKATAFWASIDANQPPAPDFTRDAAFINSLYQFAEPGKLLQATPEVAALVQQYKTAQVAEKHFAEQKAAAKAALLLQIGDAEKVRGEGFSISAGLIGPAHIEYDRAGYRDFRVSVKKSKDANIA